MTFLKITVETLVSRAKGEAFKFDGSISLTYVFFLILDKFICLLRGILFLHKAVYVDSRVKIRSKRSLFLGKSVVLNSDVYIDALSHDGISLGDSCKISSFSRLVASGSLREIGTGITIGKNVGIGEFAYIGGAGGVTIGDDTIIGQYFSSHPENHIFSNTKVLIRDQGVSRKGISIGSNCWIGAKVTICDGVSIGKGCVVAAGSVVTQEFPDNCVIAGVPARLVKYINEE